MSSNQPRRTFLKMASGAALGSATTPGAAFAQTARSAPATRRSALPGFPRVFYWGTGTSSYQIEGAWNEVLHMGGAPGERLSNRDLNQVRHHAVLSLAVQAIRARARAGTQIGFADNMRVAAPFIETPAHIKAAEAATRDLNADFITVMMEGRYTGAEIH